MFARTRLFLKKYERYVSPVTLVIGFTFDNLTLRRIDVFYSNALLISYLLLSALSIMALNIHEARRGEKERSEILHAVSVFVMQFCLGGLFSASFLFYSKSGSIIASWPFLLMLVGYILGNELLRKRYIQLTFQVSVFFTALFSYLIFFLPVILGKMGDAIFLLSGIATLIIVGLFIYVLSWFAPERISQSGPALTFSLIGLFVVINALYFTNLIPPIPLALKEAGIYQSVFKVSDGVYGTVGEKQEWFKFLSPNPIIHVESGQPLYALTAIFAPVSLSTDIVHVWEYYNQDQKQWVVSSRVDLAIEGGRENGFRTFSEKNNVVPGLWRLSVETPRGQLVGRLTFSVSLATGDETLITDIE